METTDASTDTVADLCRSYDPFARSVARDYARSLPAPKDHDGLLSACRLGVLRAAMLYDPGKAAFVTYAALKVRSAARDFVRAESWRGLGGRAGYNGGRRREATPPDVSGESGWAAAGVECPIHATAARVDGLHWTEEEWDWVLAPLGRRARKAVTLRFRQDMRYRQIAEEMGVSVSRAGRLVADAVKLLRDARPELEEELHGRQLYP